MLARRFHPDRFHQSGADLRTRIESAFCAMAQAYEVLSNSKQRDNYDRKSGSKAGSEPSREIKGPRVATGTSQIKQNRVAPRPAFKTGLKPSSAIRSIKPNSIAGRGRDA